MKRPNNMTKEKLRMIPAIEYESASMVLHKWAERLLEKKGKIPQKRKNDLEKKLDSLQKTISVGIKKGAQKDVNDEIITDEYIHLENPVKELYEILSQEKDINNIKNIMDNFFIQIAHGDISLRRKLCIGFKERHYNEILPIISQNKMRKNTLRSYILGCMFALTKDQISIKYKNALKLKREPNHSDPIQQFLVDMFLIGSAWDMNNSTKASHCQLSEIINTLYKSEYLALKIYHLSKYASMNSRSWDIPYSHAMVSAAIQAINLNPTVRMKIKWTLSLDG